MTNELRVASDAQGDAEVSVVIPCLNEVKSIAICVDKAVTAFRDSSIRGEVVVSDNGSEGGIPYVDEMYRTFTISDSLVVPITQ